MKDMPKLVAESKRLDDARTTPFIREVEVCGMKLDIHARKQEADRDVAMFRYAPHMAITCSVPRVDDLPDLCLEQRLVRHVVPAIVQELVNTLLSVTIAHGIVADDLKKPQYEPGTLLAELFDALLEDEEAAKRAL
jgi:hypothetical protein